MIKSAPSGSWPCFEQVLTRLQRDSPEAILAELDRRLAGIEPRLTDWRAANATLQPESPRLRRVDSLRSRAWQWNRVARPPPRRNEVTLFGQGLRSCNPKCSETPVVPTGAVSDPSRLNSSIRWYCLIVPQPSPSERRTAATGHSALASITLTLDSWAWSIKVWEQISCSISTTSISVVGSHCSVFATSAGHIRHTEPSLSSTMSLLSCRLILLRSSSGRVPIAARMRCHGCRTHDHFQSKQCAARPSRYCCFWLGRSYRRTKHGADSFL